MDQRHVVTSIEFVARLIGEALTFSGGVRRFGGHSLRVTGARLMAGMGISIVLIQLMARWSSEAVLRYVAEAPLQGMSDAYRKGLSTSALGTSAEEMSRQLEVAKSEAVQDKWLIHYLQQEVATLKAIEDVKVKDMGYIVNTESGVVHRHRATHRILLCCPTLQTFPARHRIDRWAKECEWKRFSPAALSKEIPSSVVAGRRAGFTARLCRSACISNCSIL